MMEIVFGVSYRDWVSDQDSRLGEGIWYAECASGSGTEIGLVNQEWRLRGEPTHMDRWI